MRWTSALRSRVVLAVLWTKRCWVVGKSRNVEVKTQIQRSHSLARAAKLYMLQAVVGSCNGFSFAGRPRPNRGLDPCTVRNPTSTNRVARVVMGPELHRYGAGLPASWTGWSCRGAQHCQRLVLDGRQLCGR